MKEHFEHKKVDRELESLKSELTELKQKVQDGEETITGQVYICMPAVCVCVCVCVYVYIIYNPQP